jgi:hypothetical protein
VPDAHRHEKHAANAPQGSSGAYRPLDNKFFVVAAVVAFLLSVLLSRGSLLAGFGALALIAGLGWVVHRLLRTP